MSLHSTSHSYERRILLSAATAAPGVSRERTFPAIIVPAFLLALVFGRVLGLGVSMGVAEYPMGGTRFPPAPDQPVFALETHPPIARGAIEGIVVVQTAIRPDPNAARQLPPPVTFMSEDIVPFQLRTSDLTTDTSVCSEISRETKGDYRFDFHDGGLRLAEAYNFLTFVTQSYRPASLSDPRLLLQRAMQQTAADIRYFAR